MVSVFRHADLNKSFYIRKAIGQQQYMYYRKSDVSTAKRKMLATIADAYNAQLAGLR